MKIYTKTGDQGQTGLIGGQRVSKNHQRIAAYGTLDELNAVLGMVLTCGELASQLAERLIRIQGELFQLGSELATPAEQRCPCALIEPSAIEKLEGEIDLMESKLEPLKNFILPGGSVPAAQVHLARTICRRAERAMMAVNKDESLRPEALQYINRLSDYLFVFARHLNHLNGRSETTWQAPQSLPPIN